LVCGGPKNGFVWKTNPFSRKAFLQRKVFFMNNFERFWESRKMGSFGKNALSGPLRPTEKAVDRRARQRVPRVPRTLPKLALKDAIRVTIPQYYGNSTKTENKAINKTHRSHSAALDLLSLSTMMGRPPPDFSLENNIIQTRKENLATSAIRAALN
jgi:hypothetical protein